MATMASYSTLPASSYPGLGSQGDLLHSANYGNYDTGIGSLTSHPYQYQSDTYANDYLQPTYSNDTHAHQQSEYYPVDRYAAESTYQQAGFSNNLTHSQSQKFQDRSTLPDPHEKSYPSTNGMQQVSHAAMSDLHQQGPHNDLPHPPRAASGKNQQYPSKATSKSNPARSEHSLNQQPPLPPIAQRPSSGGDRGNGSGTTGKARDPPADIKLNKSSTMRAAAIKQKEGVLEQKRRDTYFPSNGKKVTPTKSTAPNPSRDDEPVDPGKGRRSKKQSHSVPKQRRSRRMNYLTDESNSSSEDEERPRINSKKRPAPPRPSHDKHQALPPVRRARPPPFYDPAYDYPPLPPGHPLHRQYPYYDGVPPYGAYPYPMRYNYPPRPLYDNPYNAPPYLPPYQDPYDHIFDYEKRKSKLKTKSRALKKEIHTDHEDPRLVTSHETDREEPAKKPKAKTKKPVVREEKPDPDTEEQKSPADSEHHPGVPAEYGENEVLEVWRQERNDYLKKKFKPTIHDVLYSQQWTKADSYLENQRRRTLRDAQGYYFPYKQYTLKDYRDLQKTEAKSNPYAPLHDPLLDRKERPKKRPDYGSQRDRPAPGSQQRAAGPLAPTRAWHLNNTDPHDPEKLSKRERALEYAKVQVVRNQPLREVKHRPDPTEQYVNSLFPAHDDEHGASFNGRHRKNRSQSADEDEDEDYDDDNQ